MIDSRYKVNHDSKDALIVGLMHQSRDTVAYIFELQYYPIRSGRGKYKRCNNLYYSQFLVSVFNPGLHVLVP